MKSIKIRNGIEVVLGNDACIVIWEDYDGWNVDINEREPQVRIGYKDDEGNVNYKYFCDRKASNET